MVDRGAAAGCWFSRAWFDRCRGGGIEFVAAGRIGTRPIPTLRWLLTLGAGGSVSQCAMSVGRRSMMFAVKSDDDESIQRE
jgi:hypothetical protein